ncbi:hypothetical protein BCR35DRAFT_325248 [Leucosporidium creatinivorum]|uniref:Uncharacterized protein n=1 Tax=Leucosporidium creatinivorum TaxID=106004 RepID=A0A1Y2F752_9BASI|nr:hypothetical protein BCR35DRAFT_325248 [Leucosporidium creatinivorum]
MQQERPLSPASESSAGDYAAFPLGTAGTAAPRVCRALVVEAEAHETGVRSTVYCRIALPASSSQPVQLLALPPLSHLLHHSTYALPLGPESLSSSSTECLRAARLLGLTDASALANGASSRKDNLLSNGVEASPAGRRHNRTIKLVQQDKDLSLVLEGADSATPSRAISPSSFTSRLAAPAPTGAPSTRSSRKSNGRKEQADRMKEEKLEWILVMRLESSFGGLHEPRFANSVTIPLPLCLRNSLAFTLPISSASTSSAPPPQWDLAVKPSLRSSSSSTPPGDSNGPTTITGRFASTSALSIRWAPRNSYAIAVPQSQLEVAWGIGENGWGRVTVKGEAELEYAGLKDKAWVEVQVDHGAGSLMDNSTRAFEILSLEGEGVLAWEVVRETPRKLEPPRHPRLAREPSSEFTTPTPRPRPSTNHLQESRPPSFTNLFNTTAPEAPELDPAVVAKMGEPSLLRQAAPFEGDASLDMTFEMSSSDEEGEDGLAKSLARLGGEEKETTGSPSGSPEAPEADSDIPQAEPLHFSTTTTIRLQLSLATLLTADKLPSPTVSFELKADFPTITLRSLSTAFYPSSEPQAFRLALPTFSLPAAVHENSVVTVSAGAGGSVELLASDPMMQAAGASEEKDSPLPATGGRARWRTERSQDEGSNRRSRSSSELVEVEVSLPPSRPTSLVQLDELADSDDSPSPSPAARSASSARHLLNRPSIQSLRSKSSTLSLGLNLASTPFGLQSHRQPTTLGVLKLRITPVPPSAGPDLEKPWRLFTHLTFPRPFIGGFELPLKEGQRVVVCDSWNERGEQAEVESELLEGMMKIETGASRRGSPVVGRMGEVVALEDEMEGVCEMLFCVSTPGAEGQVEVGDVLPKMEIKVSSMEVEVLPVAGYELLTDKQAFDSATPSRDTQSTRFTRFQIPASEASRLSVFLQPIPPPLPSLPPSPVAERVTPPRETSPRAPTPATEPEPVATPPQEPKFAFAPTPHQEMKQASPEVEPEPTLIAEVELPTLPAPPPPPAIATPPPALAPEQNPLYNTATKAPAPATITPSSAPPRSALSNLLALSPFLIFLLALAIAHFATPNGLNSLNPLNELLSDTHGAWPSFDAEGELVLVQKETAHSTTTTTSSGISLSTSMITTTTTVMTTPTPMASSARSFPLPSSSSAPTARFSAPSAPPRLIFMDDLPPPPPPKLTEADQQAGLEPAGFPTVFAEIVAGWRVFEREVKGWIGWVRGWMGI